MTSTVIYALPINPEPWVVGNAYVARGGGKSFARIAPDKTLRLYQDAVQAELQAQGAEVHPGHYALEIYFARQNARYTDAAGRKRARNTPDVTNLQKATEDALQGVLIENDRHTVQISSQMVEVGPDVDPMVVIRLTHGLPGPAGWAAVPDEVHDTARALHDRQDKRIKDATEANVWAP